MPPLVSFLAEVVAGETRILPTSPQLIDRPAGMDAWILNLTLSGSGRINRGDERFATKPGDLLLWPPRTPHDYGADPATGRWTHLWVYFHPRPAWFDWLGWPVASAGVLRLRLHDDPRLAVVTARFHDVIAAYRAAASRRTALTLAWTELLLLTIDQANPLARPGIDPRIQSALDHLHGHYAAPATVASLARRAGLSPSRFAHRFREQTGVPPLTWLEQRRIAVASDLLQATGLPVGEIAAAVGYEDPAYFARVFRRRTGATPRAFRAASARPASGSASTRP